MIITDLMLIINHIEYKCLRIIFNVLSIISKQIILRSFFLNINKFLKSDDNLKEICLVPNHRSFTHQSSIPF